MTSWADLVKKKKTQNLQKQNSIGYLLAISFEWQQENIQKPSCSLLGFFNKSLEKSFEKNKNDFPSYSEST